MEPTEQQNQNQSLGTFLIGTQARAQLMLMPKLNFPELKSDLGKLIDKISAWKNQTTSVSVKRGLIQAIAELEISFVNLEKAFYSSENEATRTVNTQREKETSTEKRQLQYS